MKLPVFRLFRSKSKARHLAAERAIVNAIIPATKPQVRDHQKSALKHLELAREINWTGPRAALRGGR